MGGTVCLQCPDLHLTETLATELRLTAERLLGDEAVRTDRTGVHLVVHHVTQFHEVGHTYGSHLVERLARLAVVELGLAGTRQTGFVGPLVQLLHCTSVEDRSRELDTQFGTCPTEYSLEDLTDVHTGRHTHRVQHDIHRRTVSQERHVLYAHDLGYDTFVTVTTGHLVTHADLTAFGDIDLRHLDDTVRQLVADSEVEFLALERGVHLLVFGDIVHDTLRHEFVLVLVGRPALQQYGEVVDLIQTLLAEMLALADKLGTQDILHGYSLAAVEDAVELVDEQVMKRICFLAELEIHLLQGLFVLHLLLAVLGSTGIEFLVDDHTVQRRRSLQRSVFHVTGLVAEDSLQQLLLRTRIGLSLRSDLTYQDITRLDVSTDTDDTVLVQVFGSVLGYVRDIGGELLHAAFGVTHLEQLLHYVYGGVHVFAYDALAQYDSILIVITLPGDIGYLQVLTERQLTALGSITLGQDLTFLHRVALAYQRMEVDGGVLVGLLELRHLVLFLRRVEADSLFLCRTLVADADDVGIDISHRTRTLCHDLCAAVGHELFLDTGTYDRRLRSDQRYCLAHHVRTHQRTVGVIVLQERDERCRYRSYLARSYVHEVHLVRSHYRELGTQTGLDFRADERTVLAERRVTLGYHLVLLVLGGQIYHMVVVQIHYAVLHLAVRRLDEAQVIDLRIDTHGRDQTDVRAFRRLNRTETAVVGIVYVSHLESGAVTAQTAGTQSRHTALMGNLSQRVLLVHELAQRVGSEIAVDNRRDGLGVNQVGRSEDLVVAYVHTLTYGTRHTGQTDTELVEQLLAYRADTAVAQVVDIIHLGVAVDEHDEVLDNLDDILLGQYAGVLRDGHVQLAVDTVTAYLAQVITLLGEEQVLDHLARRSVIRRLGVTQLAVDIQHRLFLRLGRVFLQGVEDNREVVLALLVFMQQDGFGTGLQDDVDDLRSNLLLTLHHNLVTLDGRHLTGILVHEILDGRFHYITCQLAAHASLQRLAVDLHLLSQVEAVEDVLVGLETDSAEKRGHRQLLLTVDVSVHHLVDIRSELNPRSAEGDDTRRIELRAVGVHARAEEHTRRTVQLAHYHAFGTVDDERAFRRHVRDST